MSVLDKLAASVPNHQQNAKGTGNFFPDVSRSWYDNLAIQFFNYALSVEDYVSASTLQWLVAAWIAVVVAVVVLVRSNVFGKYFTDRNRKKFEEEHPRAFHSRRRLMERYVAKGLNDDLFFTSIDEKETAQLRLSNPFTIQAVGGGSGGGAGAGGGGAQAMQLLANAAANNNAAASAERRLFISIGSDSDASPYAHEDGERLADMFSNKLGYKSVHFSNKSSQPSSVNLATMAKQLKLCGRSWDHVVIFVAAKMRVCEIDRSYLSSALRQKARGQGGDDKNGDSPSTTESDLKKFPFFFLEFLADQMAPENPKNWIDLHMMTQRIIEGTTHNSENPSTEFSLILDGGYRAELAQMLPVSEKEKTLLSTSAILQTADLEKLIWESGLSRHVPICVLGSERFVVPSATAGKKPKHLGSVMVRRLVDGVQGNTTATAAASVEDEAEPLEGVEGENATATPKATLEQIVDPDEPSIAFPTAHGTTESGIYHQGVATMETLYHHMCAAWPQDSPAAKPFWQSPLNEAPVLTVQEALMPRLCLQSPIESWRCGLPNVAGLNSIRQTLVNSVIDEKLQRRTSSVVVVTGGTSSQRQSGMGVTSFLRELAHTGHMIRRDCVYIDLSLYQTRGCTESFEGSFVKLITDLGRVMVTLEHPLTSVGAAETFALRVLSAVKVVLILDHATESMLTTSPLGSFLAFLSDRDRDTAESSPKKLCVLVAPVATCDIAVVPHVDCFALGTLKDAGFNAVGYLSGHYLSTISSADSVTAETLAKLQADDQGMNLWMWRLARGVVDLGAELADSKDGVLSQVVKTWKPAEIALLRHLFLLSSSPSSDLAALRGPTGHVSMAAAVAQTTDVKFDSMWDAVPAVRQLVISGVLYLSPMIHSFSAKEVRGQNLHINPEILASCLASEVLLAEVEGQMSASALVEEVLKVYVRRSGQKLQRHIYDGFYFPGIVTLVTAVGPEAAEKILPSSSLLTYDATQIGQPTPLYRFLAECVRVRGIEATLRAFFSIATTTPKKDSAEATTHVAKEHALLQAVPTVCFRALEKHSKAVKVQSNEFFQVIYNALVAAGEEGSSSSSMNFGGIFPRDWSPSNSGYSLPEVSATFRRNVLSHNRGLRYFCPALFPQEVALGDSFYADFKPSAGVSSCLTQTITTATGEKKGEAVSANQYRTIVGFKDGSVGVFDLAQAGNGSGAGRLSKLSNAHGARVDIIMRYGDEMTEGQGDCQIVTAARSIHEIFVWSPDLSTCERVAQLTKPPAKKRPAEDSDEEDEEEDEDEAGSGGENREKNGVNVSDIKRKFYLHLVPRSLDDDTVSMYRRSAGDDEVRRHEDSLRPRGPSAVPVTPPTEIAIISVGDMQATGRDASRQRKHDSVAESVKYYNRLSCNPVDPVSGVLSISTPNDDTSFTCGDISDVAVAALKGKGGQGAEPGDDDRNVVTAHPRVVLGTSDGEIKIYKIVALPRYSVLP